MHAAAHHDPLPLADLGIEEARAVVGGWEVVERVSAIYLGLVPDLQVQRDKAAAGSSILAWLSSK